MCSHRYVTTMKEKVATNLRKSQGLQWERLEREKGMEGEGDAFIISKIRKKMKNCLREQRRQMGRRRVKMERKW